MLRFAELASEPRSVEQILREWLEPPGDQDPAAPLPNTPQRCRELEDQLSLLARWFYKKPRVGEIFFREGIARSSPGGPQDAAPAPAPIGQRAPQQRMALSQDPSSVRACWPPGEAG